MEGEDANKQASEDAPSRVILPFMGFEESSVPLFVLQDAVTHERSEVFNRRCLEYKLHLFIMDMRTLDGADRADRLAAEGRLLLIILFIIMINNVTVATDVLE